MADDGEQALQQDEDHASCCAELDGVRHELAESLTEVARLTAIVGTLHESLKSVSMDIGLATFLGDGDPEVLIPRVKNIVDSVVSMIEIVDPARQAPQFEERRAQPRMPLRESGDTKPN